MTASSTIGTQSVAAKSASQLGSWLEEYSEIAAILPVLTGLLVTNRLQLRGANALLVDIVIAAIIRQIIVQLKKQASQPTTLAAAASEAAAGAAAAAGEAAADDENYIIVHSVPGRIRLRIPRLQGDAAYAKHLENRLLTEDNVLGVRTNRFTSSLVIHYDSANLTELDLGMRLLHILEQAEQAEMES